MKSKTQTGARHVKAERATKRGVKEELAIDVASFIYETLQPSYGLPQTIVSYEVLERVKDPWTQVNVEVRVAEAWPGNPFLPKNMVGLTLRGKHYVVEVMVHAAQQVLAQLPGKAGA